MPERITNVEHPALPGLRQLYENTFPLRERRSWADLLQLLATPEMFLKVLMHDEFLIGFVAYWRLEEWLYLEHLAIEPAFRNQQYGTNFINYLLEHVLEHEKRKLVLETEPPADEDSQRRVRFYEKLGLQAVSYPYKQPPYRRGEEAVDMMLMTIPVIEKEEYKRVVRLIRREVYERFY